MEFLFVSFRSVPFLYVCWFRFGFSHKPKSMRPDGRPLFFFSRPRPNVSRLRRPGAARAQPWCWTVLIYLSAHVVDKTNYQDHLSFSWPLNSSSALHSGSWLMQYLLFSTEMSRKTWSSTAIECVPPQTSPENYKISTAAEGHDGTYT